MSKSVENPLIIGEITLNDKSLFFGRLGNEPTARAFTIFHTDTQSPVVECRDACLKLDPITYWDRIFRVTYLNTKDREPNSNFPITITRTALQVDYELIKLIGPASYNRMWGWYLEVNNKLSEDKIQELGINEEQIFKSIEDRERHIEQIIREIISGERRLDKNKPNDPSRMHPVLVVPEAIELATTKGSIRVDNLSYFQSPEIKIS